MHATLPVKLGRLRGRSAVEVAPSVYLASLHATFSLVKAILPMTISSSIPSLLGGRDLQAPADQWSSQAEVIGSAEGSSCGKPDCGEHCG